MKKYKLKYQKGGKTQGEQPSTFSGRPQIARAHGKPVAQFDSNKAKKNADGTLSIEDYSGRKHIVKRNSDGSYDMVNPDEVILSMYQGNNPGNFTQQDSAYLQEVKEKNYHAKLDKKKPKKKNSDLTFLGREINPDYVLSKEMNEPYGGFDYRGADIDYSQFDTVGNYGQGLYLLKSKTDDQLYKFIKPNKEKPARWYEHNVQRTLHPFKYQWEDILTGNPSTKPFAQEYQQGGTVNPNQILASFLATLPEEEQDQFVDEFQELSPEEQLEVIQAITQKLNPTQPQMQEGGELDYIPVEVEGKETVKLPDGELQRFEGPSHAEGGIPTMLPEGSKIYSEHLKAPPEVTALVLGKNTKKKYSYADLSKKFPTKPYEQKLQDPNLDQFEKQAAAIKLENNKTMLETIFAAQEMDKEKNKTSSDKMQKGGLLKEYPEAGVDPTDGWYDLSMYSDRFKSIDRPNTVYDPVTKRYFYRKKSGLYQPSLKRGTPPVYAKNTKSAKQEVGEPDSGIVVKGEAVSKEAKKYLPSYVDEFGRPHRIRAAERSTPAPTPIPTPIPELIPEPAPKQEIKVASVPEPVRRPTTKVQKKAAPTREAVSPLDLLPTIGLPSQINSLSSPEYNLPESFKTIQPISEREDDDVVSAEYDDVDYPGKDPWWKDLGISRQLSGTIFDSLMAASNRLNVDEPQYRDNRKTPLFTRFVDFEDKEVSKQYNLSMQQIMNSNMPEQVKQSQIANLNAKLQDYQGRQDLQRNQLYQQKLNQDTDKLQMYMDRNIDQATADLENYRMKKARIEDLKNQFKAKRRADIVNPIRKYLDFVQEVDLQNQVYSDNFAMNPWTGKVNFTKSTPDPLKKQEDLLSQYPSGAMSKNIDGGGRIITLPGGILLYEDPSGKTIEITGNRQQQRDDSRQVAAELMSRNL